MRLFSGASSWRKAWVFGPEQVTDYSDTKRYPLIWLLYHRPEACPALFTKKEYLVAQERTSFLPLAPGEAWHEGLPYGTRSTTSRYR